MNKIEMNKGAVITPDGVYRYQLWRTWSIRGRVVWIMLNPSTANASIDDPTIRRCIGFTKQWGFGSMEVVNLFALRSASPKSLLDHGDPIGRVNDKTIKNALVNARDGSWDVCVVAAWGALRPRFVKRALDVVALCGDMEVPLLCLGHTKDGHPRHPLYVRRDQERVPLTLRRR